MTNHQSDRMMQLGAILAAAYRLTPEDQAELAAWDHTPEPTSAWPGWTRYGVPPGPAPAPRARGKREIAAGVRRRVLERDRYECQACGAREDLTLDHVIPEALGGPATEANLRVLCRPCNSRKGAR